MVTTHSPSPSPEPEVQHNVTVDAPPAALPVPGFVGQIIKSIWEPGANSTVVMAMNMSFFLLLVTLLWLAYITSWNGHVLALLGINAALWATMIWFVMEISRVQTNPENMPGQDPLLDAGAAAPAPGETEETKKSR